MCCFSWRCCCVFSSRCCWMPLRSRSHASRSDCNLYCRSIIVRCRLDTWIALSSAYNMRECNREMGEVTLHGNRCYVLSVCFVTFNGYDQYLSLWILCMKAKVQKCLGKRTVSRRKNNKAPIVTCKCNRFGTTGTWKQDHFVKKMASLFLPWPK